MPFLMLHPTLNMHHDDGHSLAVDEHLATPHATSP